MSNNSNATKATFDRLFSRLLDAVAEEQDIRSRGEGFTGLIEVTDRLHALRSDLAAIRYRLALEVITRPRDGQPPRYAI